MTCSESNLKNACVSAFSEREAYIPQLFTINFHLETQV